MRLPRARRTNSFEGRSSRWSSNEDGVVGWNFTQGRPRSHGHGDCRAADEGVEGEVWHLLQGEDRRKEYGDPGSKP